MPFARGFDTHTGNRHLIALAMHIDHKLGGPGFILLHRLALADRLSGALYDKFVDFVNDLQTIGSRIEQTQSSYNDAMKKLSEGSGNLVRRAEKIKKLGAKTSKSLPGSLIDNDDDEDENLLEE